MLDEFENQRFIDPKFVTLFTGYLTILDSISIHTDSEFFGTVPLPESEEVFNTNKWELKRAILVQEETSRKLSNNILIPETFKSWRNRINRTNATWRSYNRQLNSLCMNLMATVKDPVLATSNRFHLLKCKQNKSISNVWQNSYTQFLTKTCTSFDRQFANKRMPHQKLGADNGLFDK